MAMIPAALQILAAFLGAVVIGGLLAWIFEYLLGKIGEAIG
jgi:hypothetical protein